MKDLTLDQIVDLYSKKAKDSGVELEILFNKDSGFKAAYQDGKLDPFQSTTHHILGFRVIRGRCENISYSESLTEADLDVAFKQCVDSVDLFEKSYQPKFVGAAEYDDVDFLYSSMATDVAVEDKLEKAKAIEPSAKSVSSKIKAVPYQGYGDGESFSFVYNTNGLKASYRVSDCYLYAYALAEGEKDSRMYGDIVISKNFKEIDPVATAKKAAEMALKKLDAETPKSGNYPVLFTADMAQSMIGLFQSGFNADSIDKNLSIFKDKLGKSIANSIVEITDNPFEILGVGSRPFDSEGVPSSKTPLIVNGELKTYLTNSVYAEKFQLKNTANAARSPKSALGIGSSNLVLTPGEESFEQLAAKHETVIVVDSLQGMHSGYSSVSGDFSLQAEGFLYKNGKVQGSIANFVVSGNMLNLLNNIEAIGSDVKYGTSSVIAPSFLVKELSVAGA